MQSHGQPFPANGPNEESEPVLVFISIHNVHSGAMGDWGVACHKRFRAYSILGLLARPFFVGVDNFNACKSLAEFASLRRTSRYSTSI